MPIKDESRIPLFDELRGIAIIGVIAIHSATHDVNSISTSAAYGWLVIQTMLGRFAVPCFLIISGYFVSYKEQIGLQKKLESNLIRRIQRVLPPYILWSSIYFLLLFLMGVQFSRHPALIFLEQLLTGTVALHLFFLVLIMQMYVLSWFGFMKNGCAEKRTVLFAAIAFLAFTLPSYLFINDALSLSGSKASYYFKAYERSLFPRWLLFFMFGRWMGAHWLSVKDLATSHRQLLSFCVFGSLALSMVDFYCLRLWSGNSNLLPPDWMISNVFFGPFVAIWFLTSQARDSFVIRWLGKLGAVSFGVYLLHEPFLSLLMRSHIWQSKAGILSYTLIFQPASILAGLGVSLITIAVLQHVLPERIRRYLLG